jgi:hypothetical protein
MMHDTVLVLTGFLRISRKFSKMPQSPSQSDVEPQLKLIEADRRNFPNRRFRFLEELCLAEFNHEFENQNGTEYRAKNEHMCKGVGAEAWRRAHRIPEAHKKHDYAAPKRLLEQVIKALDRYYQMHQGAPVVISIDRDTFRPKFDWQSDRTEPSPQNDALDRFSGTLHHYHLTRNEEGTFWVYSVLDINQRLENSRSRRYRSDTPDLWSDPRLSGSAHVLDADYHFELRLSGAHLQIIFQRSTRGTDSGFELFPFVEPAPGQNIYCGGMLMQTRAGAFAASSAVVLSKTPLEGLEEIPPGRVPRAREHYVQARWSHARTIQRLPEADITVHDSFPQEEISRKIPESRVCRMSVTWHPSLKAWETQLLSALNRGHVTVVLAHRDSLFTRLRSEAAYHENQLVQATAEIETNRRTLRTLRCGNLIVKRSRQAIPIAYVELDDAIYFSAWWVDRKASDGIWFSTPCSSATGEFLKHQFEILLAAAEVDDLQDESEHGGGEEPDKALIAALRNNIVWTGTMKDVYAHLNSELRAPEQVTLRLHIDPHGRVGGRIEFRPVDRGETAIVLGNFATRDRHVCFSCRNEKVEVRHVGVLLLELGDSGRELTGFYTGWSPNRHAYHCSFLELAADDGKLPIQKGRETSA